MYLFIKILASFLCLCALAYLYKVKNKYKNDLSGSKEEIIKYFEEHDATSIESGIKIKDLPPSISKDPYLLLMVQDKTLSFKKGKYYLNK